MYLDLDQHTKRCNEEKALTHDKLTGFRWKRPARAFAPKAHASTYNSRAFAMAYVLARQDPGRKLSAANTTPRSTPCSAGLFFYSS